MSRMGFSRITEHNRYEETDHLYEPLRNVLLKPQATSDRESFIAPAAMYSKISHDYAVLSPEDAHNMVGFFSFSMTRPTFPSTPGWFPLKTMTESETANSWWSMPTREYLEELFLNRKWKPSEGKDPKKKESCGILGRKNPSKAYPLKYRQKWWWTNSRPLTGHPQSKNTRADKTTNTTYTAWSTNRWTR